MSINGIDLTQNSPYFSIVRAAIWNTTPDTSEWPAGTDMALLIENFKAQAMLPMVSSVLTALYEQGHVDAKQREEIFAYVVANTQTHYALRNCYRKVVDALAEKGLHPILIKGEALAEMYPQPNLRTCGDIDLYLLPEGNDRAVEILKGIGTEYISDSPCHHDMVLDNCEIELHHHFVSNGNTSYETGINERSEEMITKALRKSWPELQELPLTGIRARVLPPQENIFYIFLHLAKHIQGDMGLRQFADMAVALHATEGKYDKAVFLANIKEVGLSKIWNLTATLLVEYLGLSKDECPAYTPQHNYSFRIMLEHIIKTGNFGEGVLLSFREVGFRKGLKAYLINAKMRMILFPRSFYGQLKFMVSLFIKRRGVKG